MSVRRLLRQIPNGLSAFRLIAAPVTAVLVLNMQHTAALTMFVLAGASDALDGYLAKTFSLGSRFGAWLDPAADKLLMLSCFLALTAVGAIPWWLALVVIGRDVVIVCGFALAKATNVPLEVKPHIVGKASTVIQVFYVAFVLLLQARGVHMTHWLDFGAWLVLLFAAWSLAVYAGVWFKAVMTANARSAE